jgi:spore germination cell wall hydrolase CwlJ-like protein
MRTKLRTAGAIAVAATFIAALLGATGSGAAAREPDPAAVKTELLPRYVSEPVIQPVAPDSETASDGRDMPPASTTLAQQVAGQPQPDELSRELDCLAGAVYFEARGETLEGQLAVARVVVARSKSGRFPDSYCGVVLQPSQFSFVRSGAIPAANRDSLQWHNAVAIAQIAHAGTWQSPVEGALFFHAARVSPSWRLRRMAQIDNHIFYR